MRTLGRFSKRASGFTLLELMVAVALFALFTLTITTLLMGGLNSFKRGRILSALRGDVTRALDQISVSVRTASLGTSSVSQPAVTNTAQSKTLSVKCMKAGAMAQSGSYLASNLTSFANGNNYTITYSISKSGDVYNLYCSENLSGSNSQYILLDNVMLSSLPGVDGSGVSYFQWTRTNSSTHIAPSYLLTARLMSGRYCGRDLLTCAMSTQNAVRSPGVSSANWMPIKASGKTRTEAVNVPASGVVLRQMGFPAF